MHCKKLYLLSLILFIVAGCRGMEAETSTAGALSQKQKNWKQLTDIWALPYFIKKDSVSGVEKQVVYTSTAPYKKVAPLMVQVLSQDGELTSQEINIYNGYGATLLHWACGGGLGIPAHNELAASLLAHGADPNAKNKPPVVLTPLDAAVINGDPAVVELLLKYKADVTVKKMGQTPLDRVQELSKKFDGQRGERYKEIAALLSPPELSGDGASSSELANHG